MKVLILSHSSDLAGAEKSMLDLFDNWRKSKDVEPVFIIRKPVGKLASELRKHGFAYHTLYYTNWAQRHPAKHPQDIYWYAKQNTRAVGKIEKIIKELKPQIVMTNTSVAPWAAIAAHNLGVPHVWFVREYVSADHGLEPRMGLQKTFKSIGELSNLVVGNSEDLAQFLSSYVDRKKITVLYPNVDLHKVIERSNEKISSPFKYNESIKLVITGRIARSKGQVLVAEAIGLLNEQGLVCELCVIGEASNESDSSELRVVIERYNIADKVHLVGHTPNPFPYVAQADVGITASTKEAFGRSTLEYMALGKPIIGSDSGGTKELIKVGFNGFLFENGDPNALAKQIVKYISNRNLVKEHGKNSKQRAEYLMRRYTPNMLYEKVRSLERASISQRGNEKNDWMKYPILLGQKNKKTTIKYSVRFPHKAAKNFVKGIYVHHKK